jgi:hypothetical protein
VNGIGVTGSGSLSSFILQPGIYQVQFYATVAAGCGVVTPTLNNAPVLPTWGFPTGIGCFDVLSEAPGAFEGGVLVQVSSPNSVLQFLIQGGQFCGISSPPCQPFNIIISNYVLFLTQLQ